MLRSDRVVKALNESKEPVWKIVSRWNANSLHSLDEVLQVIGKSAAPDFRPQRYVPADQLSVNGAIPTLYCNVAVQGDFLDYPHTILVGQTEDRIESVLTNECPETSNRLFVYKWM